MIGCEIRFNLNPLNIQRVSSPFQLLQNDACAYFAEVYYLKIIKLKLKTIALPNLVRTTQFTKNR